MKGSGSALFTDAGDYQAILPMLAHVPTTPAKDCLIRLTWMQLADLHLLHARESEPRIAYLSLPPEMVFIIFPTRRSSGLICGGVPLTMGDITVLGPGQRLHLRTTGHAAWGALAVTPISLRTFGETLTGHDVGPALSGPIMHLHMLNKDRTLLLRQHAEAVRIVETQLSHLGHSEVARGLRQDLMWALVTAIATAEPHPDSVVMRRHATVLAQFEAALLARPDRPRCIAEVCRTIGVPERTLRCYCLKALGMGPARYSHLRHLERTRLALLRPENVMASEIEVAQRCGFADLRDFVAAYRKVFGAPPRIGQLAG